MRRFRLLPTCFVLIVVLLTGWSYADTFTVTNLMDHGHDSLRWAIDKANGNKGPDMIDFAVTGPIILLSELPALTDNGTVIDASSRWQGPWPEGKPGVILDGNNYKIPDGLLIFAAGCEVRGLFITNFRKAGVHIAKDGNHNVVGGMGPGYRNVISGNAGSGVIIGDPGVGFNIVSGNYIGTDVTGEKPLGNNGSGVELREGARYNIIGGITEGERNIISGNGKEGVDIFKGGTARNVVMGNYIGTDVTGTKPMGNQWYGVHIWEAQANIVGDNHAGNLISGNGHDGMGGGVKIGGRESAGNSVIGNYIGTDFTGTKPLGNIHAGVYIADGAHENNVGGGFPGNGNIISGNNGDGVKIIHPEVVDNVVSGNYVGTDFTGTKPLGNMAVGVRIGEAAQSNTVEGNVISGNHWNGLMIVDPETDKNMVLGNYIGTDSTGAKPLGNSGPGVIMIGGARSNTVGGATPADRNIIAANGMQGVVIDGKGTDGNVVSGNYIGTDVTGTKPLGNRVDGVLIIFAQWNVIGGEDKGNVISGNLMSGISVLGTGMGMNVIQGNYIGTRANGTGHLGNGWDGIHCEDSSPVIQKNIIAYNGVYGVGVYRYSMPDLGGGFQIKMGLNAIYKNQVYEIFNNSPDTVMAEYNWWGMSPPDPGWFFGDVDYDPWLPAPHYPESVGELLTILDGMVIGKGTKNGLMSILGSAQAAIEKGKIPAAMNKLNAFINMLEAQSGKKLTEQQAYELMIYAQIIIILTSDADPAPAVMAYSVNPAGKLPTSWGRIKGK
jgi:hypothetical protein